MIKPTYYFVCFFSFPQARNFGKALDSTSLCPCIINDPTLATLYQDITSKYPEVLRRDATSGEVDSNTFNIFQSQWCYNNSEAYGGFPTYNELITERKWDLNISKIHAGTLVGDFSTLIPLGQVLNIPSQTQPQTQAQIQPGMQVDATQQRSMTMAAPQMDPNLHPNMQQNYASTGFVAGAAPVAVAPVPGAVSMQDFNSFLQANPELLRQMISASAQSGSTGQDGMHHTAQSASPADPTRRLSQSFQPPSPQGSLLFQGDAMNSQYQQVAGAQAQVSPSPQGNLPLQGDAMNPQHHQIADAQSQVTPQPLGQATLAPQTRSMSMAASPTTDTFSDLVNVASSTPHPTTTPEKVEEIANASHKDNR